MSSFQEILVDYGLSVSIDDLNLPYKIITNDFLIKLIRQYSIDLFKNQLMDD